MNTWTLAATLERAAARQTRRNRCAGWTDIPVGAVAQLVSSSWITAVGFLERGGSPAPAELLEQACKRDQFPGHGVSSQASNQSGPKLPAGPFETGLKSGPHPHGTTAGAEAMAVLSSAAGSPARASTSLPEDRLEAHQSGSQDLLSVMAFALLLGGALYI